MVLFSLSSMAGEHAQAIRDQPMLVNFFFLGVLNNVTYVILLAGAPEIAANGIGWVYFSAVAPAILVKTSSVWWFDKVSYAHRMLACTTLMAVSFVMVAFGARMSTKLLGVVCCALQSALGEASCLALTSRFPSGERRLLLTGWSSGTGIAGIAGYVWVAVFLHALEVSFAAMLVSALLVLPVALCYVYFCGVHGSFRDAHICVERGTDEVQIEVQIEGDDGGDVSKNDDALGSDHGDTATLRGRIATILPYASPLFFVYFAEYACQSGVWITIGFPPESELARKQFYRCDTVFVASDSTKRTDWLAHSIIQSNDPPLVPSSACFLQRFQHLIPDRRVPVPELRCRFRAVLEPAPVARLGTARTPHLLHHHLGNEGSVRVVAAAARVHDGRLWWFVLRERFPAVVVGVTSGRAREEPRPHIDRRLSGRCLCRPCRCRPAALAHKWRVTTYGRLGDFTKGVLARGVAPEYSPNPNKSSKLYRHKSS